jgi:hypothetical protein
MAAEKWRVVSFSLLVDETTNRCMPCWAASVDLSLAWNVPLSHTRSNALVGGVSLYGNEGCAYRIAPKHACCAITSL